MTKILIRRQKIIPGIFELGKKQTESQKRFHLIRQLKHDDLGSSHKHLLHILNGYGNQQGISYPKVQTIAEDMDLSKRRIEQLLTDVIAMNLISKRKKQNDDRYRTQKFHNKNEYRVLIDDYTQMRLVNFSAQDVNDV